MAQQHRYWSDMGLAHKRVRFLARWSIFMIGLVIMSLGIVLMIKSNLGNAPWDVLHIGLTLKVGLTIGSWSIIVGMVVVAVTSLLVRAWPQAGVVWNMIFVGLFIDLFMFLLSWLEPESILLRFMLLILGILILGYGIGIYIAPKCGAGPRDSLMLAITQLTGWKVQYVRGAMEIVVLITGWLLGGPVFIGTIIFCFGIGTILGYTLPQCQKIVDIILEKLDNKYQQKKIPMMDTHQL